MSRPATIVVVLALAATDAALGQRDTPCRERPATGWSAEIATADEPGQRLVVGGRVLVGPEREPAAGARVLAFHTDAAGYYSPGGMDEGRARLCGVVESDAEGRYRFETIRPAHYATGGPPAHVHFEVTVPGGRSRRLTLNFEGDPLLRGRPAGEPWETVRPVREDEDGVLHVERDLWVP